MTTEKWSIVVGVAQIASALAAIFAALFVSRQVGMMRKAQEVDAFLRLLEGAREPVFAAASNWVKYEMSNVLTYDAAKGDIAMWDKISKVIHFFESIGVLVERRYLNEDLVFDQMGSWIVGSWSKLASIIKDHRNRKSAPDYAENFELLSKRAERWSSKNPAKLEKRDRLTPDQAKCYYSSQLNNRTASEAPKV